jgi:hypothetical protein
MALTIKGVAPGGGILRLAPKEYRFHIDPGTRIR